MVMRRHYGEIWQHPKCPYQTDGYFPNQFRRVCYRLKNFFHNQLYPVSPLWFLTIVTVIVAFLYKNPPYLLEMLQLAGAPFIARTLMIVIVAIYLLVLLLRFTIKYFYFGYKRYLFEKKGHYSLSTKLWFIFFGVFNKLSPQLFSCEKLLPTLPLPSLKHTVAKYLDSMEPLLSSGEFAEVREMAQDFLENEGWKLQGLARLYWCFTNNYVSSIWEKIAYHHSRKGLLINSSIAHLDLFYPKSTNQAVQAARIVHLEALSMLSIDRQSTKPVANGAISLSHLWKCYATTRIPGKFMDHLKVYGLSRHIAVYHRGCIYKLDIFDENDHILSIKELSEIFMELLTRDDSAGESEGCIAALTTDSRDRWCLNRERFFLGNALNKTSLATIESAIFFLVLDDACYYGDPDHPEMLENFLKNMLTGDGRNRWADKSLNYVVSKNGRCGGTTEHSIGDGAEFDYLLENYIFTDYNIASLIFMFLEETEGFEPSRNKTPSEAIPKASKYVARLKFEIDEQMEQEIARCYTNFQEQINDVDVACTIFRDFGKGFIKENGISPDAFIQMAIQLAIFKDQGKFCLTYESASTRFYANSRTETLRPVTKESCAFVHSMLHENFDKTERLKFLKKASEVHNFHSKECMTGNGIDRHLFVLHVISKMIGLRSPFLEFYIAQPWHVSTSQVPNMTQQMDEDLDPKGSWLGAGFGAVCKDGYGICYRFAGNHSICIHITSYKSAANTDSHRLQRHLLQSLRDLSTLLKA